MKNGIPIHKLPSGYKYTSPYGGKATGAVHEHRATRYPIAQHAVVGEDFHKATDPGYLGYYYHGDDEGYAPLHSGHYSNENKEKENETSKDATHHAVAVHEHIATRYPIAHHAVAGEDFYKATDPGYFGSYYGGDDEGYAPLHSGHYSNENKEKDNETSEDAISYRRHGYYPG